MKKTVKKELKKAELTSIKEGAAFGVMEGAGLRFAVPYALALNASNFIIALLATLPGLLGTISQLFTLKVMKKYSRKRIVFLSIFCEAMLWIPILLLGVFFLYFHNGNFDFYFLILFCLLTMIGAIASPAWNSWMRDLILSDNGHYFGKRNMIVNFVIIVSMFVASLILMLFPNDRLFFGFFIIFTIAFIGRLLSAYFITKQYEPKFVYNPSSYFSLRQFVRKMVFNNFGRFVLFISLISLATSVAGAFFGVYMLTTLKFSYLQFTLVTIASVITTILFLPTWGSFADRVGNIKVMRITGLFIPLIPLLWIISSFVNGIWIVTVYLICVEFFSGFIWSGFNLAAGTFIYDATTKEKMAFCVAYFNIINAFGAFVGAIIGGLMATHNIAFFGFDALLFIFFVSAILRFVIVFGLSGFLREVRAVEDFKLTASIKENIRGAKISIEKFIGFKPVHSSN